VTETKREKTVEGAPSTGDTTAQPRVAIPDLAAMLATARQLAGKDQALLAMIDDLAAAGSKGRVCNDDKQNDCPGDVDDAVRGNATDNYAITFRGGSTAEIWIKGNGSTALDVTILDEFGNEICGGNDKNKPGIILHCGWKPRFTGPFKVSIKNLGRIANAYRLETN
jgi:hypothetical protein